MDVPAISVKDMTVRYGGATAIAGVSVEARAGEILGVLGPNGAGKSTLLKSIVGLVDPVSGRVELEGVDISRHSVERRSRSGIALVAEGRHVLGSLTVAENLRLGARPAGRLPKDEIAARLDEAYSWFPPLYERRNHQAWALSGGEAAMLVVARALMSKPRVLLLDEPSLGLAPLASVRLFERLVEMRSGSMAMLIVEQKAAGLLDMVDRAAFVRQGKLTMLESSGEIDMETLKGLYLGQESGQGVSGV